MPGVKPEKAEAEINNIINDVITNGISEKELLKVKNRIETGLTYRLQTLINKADILAHYQAFYGNAEMVNSVIDNYLKVTISDIFEQAKKYLRNDNRVVLRYLPYKFNNKIINA